MRTSLPHEIPGRATTRIVTEEARHQPKRLRHHLQPPSTIEWE